jgi:hypothetical protein
MILSRLREMSIPSCTFSVDRLVSKEFVWGPFRIYFVRKPWRHTVHRTCDALEFAASALTEENLVFLEAWRTVDRAYIDKTFNGQNWFKYRENALKNVPMNDREETCEWCVLPPSP